MKLSFCYEKKKEKNHETRRKYILTYFLFSRSKDQILRTNLENTKISTIKKNKGILQYLPFFIKKKLPKHQTTFLSNFHFDNLSPQKTVSKHPHKKFKNSRYRI